MKNIAIIDTTISDYNLGNQIIMEAIDQIVYELFNDYFVYKVQYAEKFGKQSLRYIKNSDYSFFGGTNSLSSKMNCYKQMGFTLTDIRYVDDLILLGLGWWQYQSKPNLYTRMLLKGLLSSEHIHSVRDSYTEKQLASINIKNVLNTSCPTTWNLTKLHCESIPVSKSDSVVFTLTDYNKNHLRDSELIQLLLDNYEKVYFWIQGVGDKNYIDELGISLSSKIKFINPNLKDYNYLLRNNDLDYIGTRLHAGIRAIQYGKRSLIISIDNRAKEISNDIGLMVVNRENEFEKVKIFINSNTPTDLNIPINNINRWKNQFRIPNVHYDFKNMTKKVG